MDFQKQAHLDRRRRSVGRVCCEMPHDETAEGSRSFRLSGDEINTGPVQPCGCDGRARWCREHWREFVKHAERREGEQRERDEYGDES